ncbi:hypothetical protein NHX12_005302, partial [Muraenolepis orangiensis]
AVPGSLVYQLLARDDDAGDNGEVKFYLSDGSGLVLATPAVSFQNESISYSLLINPSSLFSISGETGEISLMHSIDYEGDQHRYLMDSFSSSDPHGLSQTTLLGLVPVLSSELMVEEEQEANELEEQRSIYSKDGVPESVTTATSLLQVGHKGLLDCVGFLPCNAIHFLPGLCTASPSVPSVSASDCDSEENAELTYYMLSPDFTISPHGTIFPAGPLDYERPNHLYEFVVMAVDRGHAPRTGTTTVRIRMANINDEVPQFSQHYRTTVLAKDPDGNSITYKITTGNDMGNFVIDSQKVMEECQQYRERTSVLENQAVGSFVLQVQAVDANEVSNGRRTNITREIVATDGGNRRSSVELAITITNVKNQPPQWERTPSGTRP